MPRVKLMASVSFLVCSEQELSPSAVQRASSRAQSPRVLYLFIAYIYYGLVYGMRLYGAKVVNTQHLGYSIGNGDSLSPCAFV